MNWLRAALLALAILAPADAARSHASLLASDPVDGAQLVRAPSVLRLTFNEQVAPLGATLISADGHKLALPSAPLARDGVVEIALPRDLAPGAYLATWRVTSVDSHVIAGALVFAVGDALPEGFDRARADASGTGWTIANIAIRIVSSLALLAPAGAAFYALVVAPLAITQRRRFGEVAVIGVIGALLAIGIRGGLLLDESPTSLLTLEPWRVAVATRFGASALVAAAGAFLIAVAWRHGRPARSLAATGALAVVGSFGLSGHAATLAPAWAMGAILSLHVACAAFWFGSLAPLRATLDGPPATARMTLRRFSTVATIAVSILIAIGGVLLWRQIGDPSEVAASPYVYALAVKLVAVMGLVALALGNRFVHLVALDAGRIEALGRLRWAIGCEMVLAILAICATGILAVVPPPRSGHASHAHAHEATPAPPGVALAAAGRRVTAVVEIVPARAGRNRLLIELLDRAGEPFQARELVLEFAHGASGVSGLRRTLPPRPGGGYVLDGPELALSGRWDLRLEVLVSDFELDVLTLTINLP